MSTAGMIKVSAGCPTFDGTDYPYWKKKMRMHLEAIDNISGMLWKMAFPQSLRP